MQIIDSHCHLDYLEKEGFDIDAVIDRAKQNHVTHMVTISTSLHKCERVIELAEKYDNVYASVGVHPHESEKEEGLLTEQKLLDYCCNPKVVAIGETGLDYFYNHSKKDKQIASFKAHINVARKTQLPLIIHTRDADEDTCNILEEEYKKGAFTGLIHCFSASQELALRMLDINFYLSLSGIITFKKAQDIRDTIQKISLSHLLVETDSPFLAPVPKRGQKNEPAFTRYTAEKLAEIKNVSVEEVAKITTHNCCNVFSKAVFC